jgi:putative ABC transport system permease protein
MRFFSFVLKNVTRRRVRSSLTVIGTAVSVGAIVALVGVSNSSVESFIAIYRQQNVAIVVDQRGAVQRLTSVLSESLGDKIANIPGVKQVNTGLVDYTAIEELGSNAFVIQGWIPDSPAMKALNIRPGGHTLTAADTRGVLLGRDVAEGLKKGVGDKIPLFDNGNYTVVGIVDSDSEFESAGMWVSLADMQRFMGKKGQVTGFTIVVDHPEDKTEVARIRKAVEALGKNVRTQLPGESVTQTKEIRFLRASSWITSLIAIIIGAVGILNTMIMSVSERTKEIGILRAIGWRKGRIVRMILAESVLLSVSGGVLGTVAAVGLTRLIGKLPDVAGLIATKISFEVMAFGIAVALGVGFLGALYPAYRGAQLQPTEALRHE